MTPVDALTGFVAATMRGLCDDAAVRGALSLARGCAALGRRSSGGNARVRRRRTRIHRRSAPLHFAAAAAFAEVVTTAKEWSEWR